VSNDLSRAFEKLHKAAEGLPEVVEGVSYGTPALKIGNKLLCRVKDAETAVLSCSLEDKQILLEAAPEIYFETEHYFGWPAILVRLDAISLDELHLRLEQAWLHQAPAKLVKAWKTRHAL
jgi:hypothetical protein